MKGFHMNIMRFSMVGLFASSLLLFSSCAIKTQAPEYMPLTSKQATLAEEIGVSEEEMQVILGHQLYELSPRQTDQYMRYLHATEPDLRERIGMIAEKNLGQPYELYLLGESPFEPYDDQPLYELAKSDCVVFAEHAYAMGLSDHWAEFFTTLQHIRYNEGQVGVVTRNHYTEYDWNRNNSWLVDDISEELAGGDTEYYTQVVNKERFFAKRYKLDVPLEKEKIEEAYIPVAHVPAISDQLQTGDFVNFVRSKGNGSWVGHVGLIKKDPDGTVYVIHSTPPKVIKQELNEKALGYVETMDERLADGKSATIGFKFLRLREDPMTNLASKFGGEIPTITLYPTKHEYMTAEDITEKFDKKKSDTATAATD